MDPQQTGTCSSCGAVGPRADMFGLEPDLQCPNCAQDIRVRTFVRYRPVLELGKPVVTIATLAICTILWMTAAEARRAGTDHWLFSLLQWFPIWEGEVWRHAVCTIVHFEWWHWGMNGLALWQLGRIFEATYGRIALAGTLIVTGTGAAALAWIFQVGPSVGISGAIFGICGFLWAQRTSNPVAAAVMNERMRRMLIMWLIVGIVLSQTGTLPISNWGHGGGLALGWLLGFAAAHAKRRILVPAVVLFTAGIVVASVYVSLGTYEQRDSKGKVVLSIPGDELRERYLSESP